MNKLLDPIKAESLTDVFIVRFERLILSGRLAIGQKLPSERELAMQLGVSRPVVHEGLVDLAFKGLVSMTPRVGTVVNDYRKEGSLALLTSLVGYAQGALDPKLLDSTLHVRRLVEVETARLAATHRTDEHLAAFDDLLAREGKIRHDDTVAVAELDFAFHHQIAMATDNVVYPLLVNTFKQFYLNLSTLFFRDVTVVPLVFDHHRRLVAAIRRGHDKSAARLMRELLDHGERRVRDLRDNPEGRNQ